MAEWGEFKHGGVRYPLTSALTNSLLRDADPALYFAIDFIASSLRTHIGPRLTAEAATVGLVITNAVAQTLHVEPSPFLLADQFRFPALAVYRKGEVEDNASLVYGRDTSEWEFAYVLPPMTPRQTERLQPILRSAWRVIAQAVGYGWDPTYNAGSRIWKLAGIEQARVVRATYGGYEPIDNIPNYYRAVVGTIAVIEREMPPPPGQFEPFTGVDATLSDVSDDGTSVTVVQLATYPAPTVTNITPSVGTKAGGTAVTILGTGFRVGQPARAWIGSKEASGVVVLSATQIQCVTPEHDAYPTFIADVLVQNFDGQKGRLPAAFTFTTP